MRTTFNYRSVLRSAQLIVFLTAILYFGKELFVPLLYGLLIAIVLYPVCKWLELRGWPRSLAIAAGLFIVIVLFLLLLGLLAFQVNTFRKDLPDLLLKLKPLLAEVQNWLALNVGLSPDWQKEVWANATHNVTNNAGSILSTTLSATAGTMVTLFLVPVYAALFLYNRGTFVLFLEKIAGDLYRSQLQSVLANVIHTYFNFIKGMVLVYIIVGILNSIGLLALGIKHAILFGMLTAVMTIIPYVGIILSALLPISVALATKDSMWYAVGVVAVFAFVQYLEANVIFPGIVGAQLKLSTWATLVAIVAGGLLWGISGMILFLPFLGIFKIVTDHVPGWQSVNILLRRDIEK
jgi:predicted PurR-regulated permease PerM